MLDNIELIALNYYVKPECLWIVEHAYDIILTKGVISYDLTYIHCIFDITDFKKARKYAKDVILSFNGLCIKTERTKTSIKYNLMTLTYSDIKYVKIRLITKN